MSARGTRRFWRDDSGAAAAEFVLWLSLLILPLINAVDLGVYVFKKMQVETAAQAGSHAVWRFCDTSAKLPAVKLVFLGDSLGQVGIFVLFIVTLLLRPQGLFGSKA